MEPYQTCKFLNRKGNHNMKRQPMDWEKIFANNTSTRT